jgi:hypothetical protein
MRTDGELVLDCPFEYVLTDEELKKLGELSLTWSHIEHTIGNCLAELLKLDGDEGTAIVFPLGIEQRLRYLRALTGKMNDPTKKYLAEFCQLSPGLQAVRNSVAHGILVNDVAQGPLFHLRSKDRTLSKADIFACEDLTNYMAHLAICLRYAIGFKSGARLQPTLPDRPEIPECLRAYVQIGNWSCENEI